MAATHERVITIFGSSRAKPGSADYVLAYELGCAIALAGWVVCNGGYDGTMEAAARGALTRGGKSIGVTSKAFRTRTANRKLTRQIRTKDLYCRLRQLVEQADGFVVLPGGVGTLLELALVLELAAKSQRGARPLVLIGDHWRPVWDIVRRERRSGAAPRFVETAAEAISALSAAFVKTAGRRRGKNLAGD